MKKFIAILIISFIFIFMLLSAVKEDKNIREFRRYVVVDIPHRCDINHYPVLLCLRTGNEGYFGPIPIEVHLVVGDTFLWKGSNIYDRPEFQDEPMN